MVETLSTNASPSPEGRKAVIVGGGPTGTLTALYLAQMGWQVSVYERRSAEFKASGNRRSFNIILSSRGRKALTDIGVELPPEKQVLLQGNVRHTAKGGALGKGFSDAVSVDRATLAQVLISEGQHRFPDKIQYHFDQTLLQVNFQDKTALFQGKQDQHQQNFDLLIGADGVFSTVRTLMESKLQGFEVQQNRDNMMYKICDLGFAKDLPGAEEKWAESFHTWPSVQPLTLLAPPSTDGSLKGVLILPQVGDITYETIQSETDVLALFKEKFPDVFPKLDQVGLPPQFAQDLLSQKAAYGGITTQCNQFEGGDCVVLLGDAAHSVWPSLGQGCNAALESCRMFAEVLAQTKGDVSLALPAYTAARKPDTDAVARLSEIGFGGNKRAGNILFIAKVVILMLLHKLLPRWFHKYALFQLGDADVPYSKIWQQVQHQNQQLRSVLTILMGIVLVGSIVVLKMI